jgi:hypothetical protein
MCLPGTATPVRVKIAADLAFDGIEKWKDAMIDSCIAPLIAALQASGIDMRGSCCGHGRGVGEINLSDGRILLIISGPLAVPGDTAELLNVRLKELG